VPTGPKLSGAPTHPREAAIVIAGGEDPPALVLLARVIGLAGLALGIERVELLLEPLLARFAGVDGAAGKPVKEPAIY
jgi:hypothetical protein